ncbi:MAG: TadE/TadG family type IV pilus assembly protein [Sporichthyaceae bacterium]
MITSPVLDTRPEVAQGDRERGSIAVELVLLAPLLIALLVFVVGLGRIAHTRGQVDGAAADAARSASLERAPSAAQQAGERAARAYLGDACQRLDIEIDVARLRPGGAVIAQVRCVASLAGLGMAGFPGSRSFTATSHAPIDTYRGR